MHGSAYDKPGRWFFANTAAFDRAVAEVNGGRDLFGKMMYGSPIGKRPPDAVVMNVTLTLNNSHNCTSTLFWHEDVSSSEANCP